MRELKSLLSDKGTSLIEVILYIALFSLIIVVVVDLLITSGGLKTESESQNWLQTDANLISTRLSYEVRNATAVVTPAVIGQTAGSLTLTFGSETHSFSLNSGSLLYENQGVTQPTNLNSSQTSISGLAFQVLGNTGGKLSLKIDFTISTNKVSQQGILTKSYQIIVTQR